MCETYGSSYGVFDCINCAHSDTGYANALKDSAIARSSGYWGTLWYDYGRLNAGGLNVTRNNCDRLSSGIYCYPSVINASLSFSAFTNNTCDYICIWFDNDHKYNEMRACYVFDNKQSSYSTGGTIYCWYYLTITDSYINNNVASLDFYCVSGTITVKNCVVNMSKEKYGTVTYNSCKESAEIIDIDFRDDCYVWIFKDLYRVGKRCTCMRLQGQSTGRKNVLLAFLYV